MKLELVDRFGREQTLYVHNPVIPVLVDEEGRPVIDFGELFPQPRPLSSTVNESFAKYITDAFVQRPSPAVAVYWLDLEGTSAYRTMFKAWKEAMMVMTGKLLVRVSK